MPRSWGQPKPKRKLPEVTKEEAWRRAAYSSNKQTLDTGRAQQARLEHQRRTCGIRVVRLLAAIDFKQAKHVLVLTDNLKNVARRDIH